MKEFFLGHFFLLCLVLSIFCGGLQAKQSKGNALRVMSFNIRLGVANDGENRWDLRKDLVVKTIRDYNPDLLGLQEVFPMQEEYLRKNFPDYLYYGRSRLVNPKDGEACSVMFRKERFEAIKSQHSGFLKPRTNRAVRVGIHRSPELPI